ncbi:MAG TPA: ATP-binding protein [Myxococcota bacterium]|nr:ATP-binding protein [Myxococcota bacterium]HQK50370.1 ATP-binding protein [Myxococcota bacterium]
MADSSVIRKLDTPLRRIPGAFRHRSFVAMLVLALAVIVGTCLVKRQDLEQRREDCLRKAEVRLTQKVQFRRDRFLGLARAARAQARMMAEFPSFRGLLSPEAARAAEAGAPEDLSTHVGMIVDAVLQSQDLASVALVDASGKVRLRKDRFPGILPDALLADLARKTLERSLEDFFEVVPEVGSWLLVAHPVDAEGSPPSSPPLGVVAVALAPDRWRASLEPVLFPEFPSEEVLLALSEGDRLRILTPPPLSPNRIPQEDLLPVRGPARPIPEYEGIHLHRGSDYRGRDVLAVTASIPGLPLSVVAKSDEDEVLRPIREETSHFFWILGLLVLLALLFFLLLSRHYRTVAFRRMLEVENRYRVLAEQARDIILVISPEGRILEANRAAVVQYGYAHTILIGMPLEQLHAEGEGDSVRARLAEALDSQTLYETEHRRSDGSVFAVEVSARSVRRDHHLEVLAIIRDLSERRRKEMQAQISQRMEVLGQLAGGVAHDFNNLLTAIRGFAAMVLETLTPEDPRHGYLEEVVLASDRAAELTSKLLSFSRGHAVEKKIVDLNRVVEGMEALFHRLVREDIQVALHLEGHPLWVRADPRQIETLLMNLVVNSRDAMPKGGVVTIRTRLRPPEESRHSGGPIAAQLVVEDNGIGMSEEVRSHAFEPFFTTKGTGQGTGLGLATVFGIVQQHDGRVWIESEPGRGTRVWVELPLSSPTPSEEIRAFGASEGRIVGGNETILLVEDHPDVRSYVRTVLESFGYRVLEARDAAQALELLSQPGRDQVDLLVSDVVMPGGNGIELWNRARAFLPNLPVLFITGYAERSLFQTTALPQAAPLLQKPFRAQELARKVREILDRLRRPGS